MFVAKARAIKFQVASFGDDLPADNLAAGRTDIWFHEHHHSDTAERRTAGRAEDPETLDEQLDEGLEQSFPGSDPVSVTSSGNPGSAKNLNS